MTGFDAKLFARRRVRVPNRRFNTAFRRPTGGYPAAIRRPAKSRLKLVLLATYVDHRRPGRKTHKCASKMLLHKAA